MSLACALVCQPELLVLDEPTDLPLRNDQRLFRTVTALGSELRRQGAFVPGDAGIDLIDLAYAAIAAADGEHLQRRAGALPVNSQDSPSALKSIILRFPKRL